MHPIQLQKFKKIWLYIATIQSWPKLAKMAKKNGFWAKTSTVNPFWVKRKRENWIKNFVYYMAYCYSLLKYKLSFRLFKTEFEEINL